MLTNRQKLYRLNPSIQELIKLNNSHGFTRCRGHVYTKNGKTRITRCKSFQCWLCGEDLIKSFSQACLLFTLSLDSAWVLTFKVLSDHANPKSQKQYAEKFLTWLRRFKHYVKTNHNSRLSYIAVHSIGKNGLHTHLITSHKPPRSLKIGYAKPVKNPVSISKYMGKNLKRAVRFDYHKHWAYTHKSNDFPTRKKPNVRTETAWIFEVKNDSPAVIEIDYMLLVDALKLGFKPGTCSRCKRKTERITKRRCEACKAYDREYRKRKKAEKAKKLKS